MQDLRLVGVAHGGEHLAFVDDRDNEFRVPVDDALRQAVRHVALMRTNRTQERVEPAGVEYSPRQVQALIRAGADRAEAARVTGWSEDKVARFEAPIIAERSHISTSAQQTNIRGRGKDGAPVTLSARVMERLEHRGVDADDMMWDAVRPEGSAWMVIVTFLAGGRTREARWRYDAHDHSLEALDDEARWLSEDEEHADTLLGPRTPGHHQELHELSPTHPSLREERRAARAESAPQETEAPAHEIDPIDLVSAIRERTTARRRRGRRSAPVAPVEETRVEESEEALFHVEEFDGGPETMPLFEEAAASPEPAVGDDATARTVEDVAYDEAAYDEPYADADEADVTAPLPVLNAVGDEPVEEPEPEEAPVDETPKPPQTEALEEILSQPRKRGKGKGRPSVPSWDDVMFGSRNQD